MFYSVSRLRVAATQSRNTTRRVVWGTLKHTNASSALVTPPGSPSFRKHSYDVIFSFEVTESTSNLAPLTSIRIAATAASTGTRWPLPPPSPARKLQPPRQGPGCSPPAPSADPRSVRNPPRRYPSRRPTTKGKWSVKCTVKGWPLPALDPESCQPPSADPGGGSQIPSIHSGSVLYPLHDPFQEAWQIRQPKELQL